LDLTHSSSKDDGGIHSLFLDSSVLVGLSSLGLNDGSLLSLDSVKVDVLNRHSLVVLSLLCLVLSSNSSNLHVSDLLECSSSVSLHSHLLLMSMLHSSSLHDLSLHSGGRLHKGSFHLLNTVGHDSLCLKLLLKKFLLLFDSLALDLSSSLLVDDHSLPLSFDHDLLLASSLGLDDLKSSDLLLASDFLLSLDSLKLNLLKSNKSVGFSLHSSGFFLHHGFLLGILLCLGSSSESNSFLLSPVSLLFFTLSLLLLDGLLLLPLDSLFLEFFLLLGLLLLGFVHFAGSASTFLLSLLSLDLGGLSSSSGGLDDGDLGFSLGLDRAGGFHDHSH
jgi:hypothetical protein